MKEAWTRARTRAAAGAPRRPPPTKPFLDGGLALSDDFEATGTGGPPNPALWTIAQPDCTGAGKLAVDDSQAHSGKHSVRVDGGGGYCDHIFFANSGVISTLGPQVYARFFLRVSAPLGAGHVTFLAMKDTADKGNDVRMGGQDMILMYNRQSDDATLPVLSPTGTGKSIALTPEKWTCVELHVDEGAGTIDTWIDGAEIAGLVENGTAVARREHAVALARGLEAVAVGLQARLGELLGADDDPVVRRRRPLCCAHRLRG